MTLGLFKKHLTAKGAKSTVAKVPVDKNAKIAKL